MEASAYGLPIISTKHSGIVDVVIDGVTGYLVQEGDYITMAEYAIEILSDRDKARQFGERGRERTERFFSHKVTHNRVREILEWAIGLKSKPILIPDWHNQLLFLSKENMVRPEDIRVSVIIPVYRDGLRLEK